ncbi:hypothetical protein NM688_g9014 [Phlebia brevispora]|uniref:Uncharacterized protein n=1 Tax=Phlebia brevispora TaxID=194682 RepID=A0ACC1RMD0_9APHY|nr:hypothetical protein NM688_g9014 [Phlebia brevispora]
MGHEIQSHQAEREYQPNDRPVDNTGMRFGLQLDTSISDLRSSVAYGRDRCAANALTVEDLQQDYVMRDLINYWRDCDEKVKAAHDGKSAHRLGVEEFTDPLVQEAVKAWANVSERYDEMMTDLTMQRLRVQPKSSHPLPPPSSSEASLSETLVPAVDPVADPVAAKAALYNLQDAHPLIPLVQAHLKDNPRFHVMDFYWGLIKSDTLRSQSQCPWCFHNDSLTKAQREKTWSNLTSHMWTCDAEQHPGCERCPMCGLFVTLEQVVEKTDGAHLLQEYNNNVLAAHFTTCFGQLLVTLGLTDPPSVELNLTDVVDVDEIDFLLENANLDDESRPPSAMGAGAEGSSAECDGRYPLFAHVFTSTSKRPTSIYFCPVCLFDVSRQWLGQQKHKSGRLFNTYELWRMYRHIYSHWADKGTSRKDWPETGLACSREFTCNYPKCAHQDQLQLKEFIEHLHNDHGVPLLECNQDHDHPPNERLVLPDRFRYQADAEHEHEVSNTALDPVTLYDQRSDEVKQLARNRISSRLGIAPESTKGKGKQKQKNEDEDEYKESDSDEELEPPAGPAGSSTSALDDLSQVFARFQQSASGIPDSMLDTMRTEDIGVDMLADPSCIPELKEALKLNTRQMSILRKIAQEYIDTA